MRYLEKPCSELVKDFAIFTHHLFQETELEMTLHVVVNEVGRLSELFGGITRGGGFNKLVEKPDFLNGFGLRFGGEDTFFVHAPVSSGAVSVRYGFS